MTNAEIYKRTLGFSIRRLGMKLLSVLLIIGLSAAGFLIMEPMNGMGLIGLSIGLVVSIILVIFIARFVAYSLKAGQIAMMTQGITEGRLPEDVYEEGKRVVKERFATVAVFFALTGVIRGIFNQLGRTITKLGGVIGGETGGAVGDAVSSAVQTLVAYLCDCCLGWVFYRKTQSSARATCEGAVLFFRHGKTLLRNAGRIFGIGLLSLLLIGGVFFGVFFLIFAQFPMVFAEIAAAFATDAEASALLTDPTALTGVAAFICALVIWSVLHTTFVRPFVLTGVLRNYLESGMNDVPSEATFAELAGKSKKFAKLQAEL